MADREPTTAAANRRWHVFRETPTREVWARMAAAVDAESGEAAIESVCADLPDHLLGRYIAFPDDAVAVAFVKAEHEHSRKVVVA